MAEKHDYYVYIMTNFRKTVLYIGVTNDISRRIVEHSIGLIKGFTKRYKCYYLIYYEYFTDINIAIYREKEIKKLRREKSFHTIKRYRSC